MSDRLATSRAILDRSFDLSMLVGPDGRLQYVSPSSARIIGVPAEELVGHTLTHLMLEEDSAERLALWLELVSEPRAARSFRYRCRHADGRVLVMDAHAQSFLDDPDVGAIIFHSRDITDVVDGEARFRVVTDSLSDGLMLLKADGSIAYVNAAVGRILGYTHAERAGRPMLEMVHPEDFALVGQTFETVRLHGRARIDSLRVRARDGQWRVVEGGAASLPEGKDGAVVVVTYRDITERHAARQALAYSERRFRALTERGGASVLIASPDGTITYASDGVSALGLTRDERVGANLFARIHADDVAIARETFDDVALKSGSTRTVRVRLQHADGKYRWLDSTCTNLIEDPAVGGVVINNLDVTDRVVAEERLRSAERLEAMGRLAAGVAHDFNNLLLGILGTAAELQRSLTDPQQIEDVEQIRLAGERGAGLTRQILAFTRRQVLKRETVDVNAVLHGLVKMLRRVMRADVTVDVLTEEDAAVYADTGQLEHVIVNLAVNASDAMPFGGKLTIQTSRVDLGPDPIDLDAVTGPHVCIRVSDTGAGMPPDVVARIFEPFFTTKELGRGTGLGLATVHGVVRQHHGRIRVDSAVGKGTTFEVYLPSAEALSVPTPLPQHPTAAAPGHEVVLVADDDEIARRITVRVLERAGYRVLLAKDGQEAVQKFEQNPDVKLVLLDVIMPGLGGPAALKRMRALRPDVRSLFASGYAGDDVADDVADNALQKPFDPEELLSRVRQALDA